MRNREERKSTIMRNSLIQLIDNTIILNYELPNNSLNIPKTKFSAQKDFCFSSLNDTNISEIIYNAIVDYSFNDFDIDEKKLDNLLARALQTRIRYNESATSKSKLSYGFYGEVLLYVLLIQKFSNIKAISRGYFFDPMSKSETKGYDCYHLIDSDIGPELWFGETKFYKTFKAAIDSVFSNIEKAISDDYFSKSIIAMENQKNNLNVCGSIIEQILNNWENDPKIIIIDEIKKYNAKLVYPVLITANIEKEGYDTTIRKAIEYINSLNVDFSKITFSFSIFFILLPVNDEIIIKQKVIEWIESAKQVI